MKRNKKQPRKNLQRKAGSPARVHPPRVSPPTSTLLRMEEGSNLEFKEKLSGLDDEDFVSFSNATGGTILVGVREQNATRHPEVIGCKTSEAKVRTIAQKAHSCRPPIRPAIRKERVKGRLVIRIDVPEGDRKPYCTSGGTYKLRVEAMNQPLFQEAIEALLLARQEAEFLGRFRQASHEIIKVLEHVEYRILEALRSVEWEVERARHAADDAASAASDAASAIEGD